MQKYSKITAVFTVTLRFRATGLFVTFMKNQKCAHFWTVTLRAVQSDPYNVRHLNPTFLYEGFFKLNQVIWAK